MKTLKEALKYLDGSELDVSIKVNEAINILHNAGEKLLEIEQKLDKLPLDREIYELLKDLQKFINAT